VIVFTNYSKEIGRRKSVKKGLLPVVKDVADRIMGSQTVNLVPNGRYTLEDIYRVNFPGPQRGVVTW
jgi:hypothetical protein